MSAAHLLLPTTIEPPRRKRFTRPEVQRIAEDGLLDGQRFELIEGDLIDKMGQNPPHAFVIGLVVAWLTGIFGTSRLRVQVPIEVAVADQERSCPEPDVAVLVEAKPEYQLRHPRGDELLLVAEVADTSAQFDLTVKARLYARAVVPEYWVLDIASRWLVIHRHPVDGEYRQVTRLSEQESISLTGGGATSSVVISQLLPAQLA
jgi:Uma2 family endonuclease